jgi:hypothetical protein
VTSPLPEPLYDADGVEMRFPGHVQHVDAPLLRGRAVRRATPTKVLVTWPASDHMACEQTSLIAADLLIQYDPAL